MYTHNLSGEQYLEMLKSDCKEEGPDPQLLLCLPLKCFSYLSSPLHLCCHRLVLVLSPFACQEREGVDEHYRVLERQERAGFRKSHWFGD